MGDISRDYLLKVKKSLTNRSWEEFNYDNRKVLAIAQHCNLSEISARLLSTRGVTIENCNQFINPDLESLLPDPFVLKDMDLAIKKILQVTAKKEKIGIIGDYDVDGISSASLLKKFFDNINVNSFVHITDRFNEGYGVSIDAIKKLYKKGVKLVISVDCGIQSFDSWDEAKKLNIESIIIDHHHTGVSMPPANAIINPFRLDDSSELNHLCSAGLTFIFILAISNELKKNNFYKKQSKNEFNIFEFCDLVSLATVCDQVPLKGINRAFVKMGIEYISKRKNIGIRSIIDHSKIISKPNTYHIGFTLGPRINASSRLGDATSGYRILVSENSEEALNLAIKLERMNIERQTIESHILREAVDKAEKQADSSILCVCSDGWHRGVIGIIASRLVEIYSKPAVVISLDNQVGVGSGRSISGFNLGSNFNVAVERKLLLKGGGHSMAGGFTIKKDRVDEFVTFLESQIKNPFNSNPASIKVDGVIKLSGISKEFYENVSLLAPFGTSNPEPKFAIPEVNAIKIKVIKEKHISFIAVDKEGKSLPCFVFNGVHSSLNKLVTLKQRRKLNLIARIQQNDNLRNSYISLNIVDIAIC